MHHAEQLPLDALKLVFGQLGVIKQGDDWLRSSVPQLLATSHYQAGNTAVFITWDEDQGSESNHILTWRCTRLGPRKAPQ